LALAARVELTIQTGLLAQTLYLALLRQQAAVTAAKIKMAVVMAVLVAVLVAVAAQALYPAVLEIPHL
jgi:hypothetical protein